MQTKLRNTSSTQIGPETRYLASSLNKQSHSLMVMSEAIKETNTINMANKLTKQDAATIAQGKQLINKADKGRLRSSSGKIYQSEISLQTENMATIEEIVSKGGIDHAKSIDHVEEALDENSEENGQVISKCCEGNTQVIHLIQNLQKSVDAMNEKIGTVADLQTSTENRISNIENKQQDTNMELAALKDVVDQYQVKVDILSDLVVKQHQEIEELKGQMTDCQIRGMQNNIVISGIPEKANENCIRGVNEFLVDKLLIKDKLIPIEKAYRIGSGSPKQMLVSLRHAADKGCIFQHVGNLKGQKVNGVHCFVSNHLPEAANEKRRVVGAVMSKNKKKGAKHRLPYSVKKGNLMFNERPVEQKVRVPLPGEMLRLTEPEIDDLNNLKISNGLHEERHDNTFHGFAISATTHSEVNQAYRKLKLMHGQASHIACAYSLRSVKPPYNAGGVDDGEHGASRVMLQLLQEGNLNNIAVFMVRYYSGIKLGPLRFDLMKQVTSTAITAWQVSLQDKDTDPNNSWNQMQESEEQDEEAEWQNTEQDDISEQTFRKGSI